MKYFKRALDEIRVDEFGNWGKSTWYFETNIHGLPIRQVEVYENGKVLKYNQTKLEDEFGQLGDQQLDLIDFSKFQITKEQFEKVWNDN